MTIAFITCVVTLLICLVLSAKNRRRHLDDIATLKMLKQSGEQLLQERD